MQPPENGRIAVPAAITVIAQLTALTAMASMTTGLITISIPRMAKDLDVPQRLTDWYAFLSPL